MSELDDLLEGQEDDGRLIRNFINNTLNRGVNNLNRNIWESRAELLDSYWVRFSKTHRLLFKFQTDLDYQNSPYYKEDHYGLVEWAYTESKARISAEITAYQAASTSTVASTPPPANTVGPSHENVQGFPIIKLKVFNGDLFEWHNFKEMYTSLVYNQLNIDPVRKLQYLLSSLGGEAAQRVKNTSITGANLATTWNALLRKYDNHQLMFQAQL